MMMTIAMAIADDEDDDDKPITTERFDKFYSAEQ